MELEFDNEIDALLRKARDGSRGVLVGDTTKLHLDADEISAFAEHAVPDSTKQKYITHFADCERCRSTLSDLILLNSEAGTEVASVVSAPVENTVPWYRKLLLFPNLAYAMGGLVLLFSGFLAFSVIKNSENQASSDISQIAKTQEPATNGPNLGYEETYDAANKPMANAMNSAANTMANAANSSVNTASTKSAPLPVATVPSADDYKQAAPSFSTDGILSGGKTQAETPPAKPAERPVTMSDKNDLGKAEEQRRGRDQEVSKEKDENKLRSQPAPSGPFKSPIGPSRNERNDSGMRENAPAAKKSAQAESSISLNSLDRRQVSGKTFERKGVWYDSAYRGQPTTNVRRGTSDYKKLESGLRLIGDNLGGTIVVVWKEKAYRID
jgi:hypothetical protein